MSAPLMAAMTISDSVDRVDQPEQDREHRDPEGYSKSIHVLDDRPAAVRDPCRTGHSAYRFYVDASGGESVPDARVCLHVARRSVRRLDLAPQVGHVAAQHLHVVAV